MGKLFSCVLMMTLILSGCGGGGGGGTNDEPVAEEESSVNEENGLEAPDGNQGQEVNGGESEEDPAGETEETGEEDAGAEETAEENVETASRNFLGVYVVGSDLEDYGYYGSTDLYEIVAGYEELTAEEKERLDLLVAFGGARRSGWRGVKFADIDCLVQDYQDGKFGNDSCYLYSDSLANMADGSTLERFLSQKEAGDYQHSSVILWNHGGAYQGIGWDSGFSGDRLTLQELEDAFGEGGNRYDIIGMDACLMASLEVAYAVREYGRYMVASTELEPGHGWDYTEIVRYMGRNPDAGTVSFGKEMVDSFLDSSSHRYTYGKTLSLLDLSQAEAVSGALDTLSLTMDGFYDYQTILYSLESAIDYGKDYGTTGVSVDLRGYASELRANDPGLTDKVQSLEGAIDEMVVYKRGQLSLAASGGLSIVQPINAYAWTYNYAGNDYASSQAWDSLAEAFVNVGKEDTEAPTVANETSCSVTVSGGVQEGYCMNFYDDLGLRDVDDYHMLTYGNSLLLLSTEKTGQTGDGKYYNLTPDGQWLYFCNGSGDDAGCIFPSAYYVGEYGSAKLYVTLATVNGEEASLFMEYNSSNGNMETWYYPVTEDGVPSKAQYDLETGDTVSFSYFTVSTSGATSMVEGDQLTFDKGVQISKRDLDATIYYFSIASDYVGNLVASELHNTSGTESDEASADPSASAQYANLEKIQGATLSLYYSMGFSSYHDYVYLDEAPYYDSYLGTSGEGSIKAWLQGETNLGMNVLCYNIGDILPVYGYDYFCGASYSSGSEDVFLFNVDSFSYMGEISGYYAYSISASSSLSTVLESPNSYLSGYFYPSDTAAWGEPPIGSRAAPRSVENPLGVKNDTVFKQLLRMEMQMEKARLR